MAQFQTPSLKATGSQWTAVETYRAADGFEAEIKSRVGLSGATVFGAFNKEGMQLFGMQQYGSIEAIRKAIGPTA